MVALRLEETETGIGGRCAAVQQIWRSLRGPRCELGQRKHLHCDAEQLQMSSYSGAPCGAGR